MKKNRTMRAAVLMLALTLITSCFVGSTFAKYTTGISGNDTARVANFGVTLAFNNYPDAAFATSYDDGSNPSVKSTLNPSNDVIAPGTAGTAFVLEVDGDPEVDVNVQISLGTIKDACVDLFSLAEGKSGFGLGQVVLGRHQVEFGNHVLLVEVLVAFKDELRCGKGSLCALYIRYGNLVSGLVWSLVYDEKHLVLPHALSLFDEDVCDHSADLRSDLDCLYSAYGS